jgi:hypothetical protein
MPKLTVLCLNDYPIGVYSSEQFAEFAAVVDWKGREPRWREQGLKFKESFDGTIGSYVKWHYHQHEFEVDAEARL